MKFFPNCRCCFHKPKVRYFEGRSGLGIVLDEILNEADEVISMSSVGDIFTRFSEFFPKFSHKRAKRKIPIRIISRDSTIARERQKCGPQELRTIKLIDSHIPFVSIFFIWNNKIAMSTAQEDFMIVVVESKDIVDTYRGMFEWMWQRA